MKLRIVSNGTAFGTEVLNAETGEPVENVQSVTFHIDTLGMPRATIEILHVEVEIEADFDVKTSTIRGL